jgi:hypothetical protein
MPAGSFDYRFVVLVPIGNRHASLGLSFCDVHCSNMLKPTLALELLILTQVEKWGLNPI